MPTLALRPAWKPFARIYKSVISRLPNRPDHLLLTRCPSSDDIDNLPIPFSTHSDPLEFDDREFFAWVEDKIRKTPLPDLRCGRVSFNQAVSRDLLVTMVATYRKLIAADQFIRNRPQTTFVGDHRSLRLMAEFIGTHCPEKHSLSLSILSFLHDRFAVPLKILRNPPADRHLSPTVFVPAKYAPGKPALLLLGWHNHNHRLEPLVNSSLQTYFNLLVWLPFADESFSAEHLGLIPQKVCVSKMPIPVRPVSVDTTALPLNELSLLTRETQFQLIRQYRKALPQAIALGEAIFSRFKPDVIASSQADKWYNDIFIQLAKARRLPLLAFQYQLERIHAADYLFASSPHLPDRMINHHQLPPGNFSIIGDLHLNSIEVDRLPYSDSPFRHLKIPPGKKIAFFANDPGNYINTFAQKLQNEQFLIRCFQQLPEWHLVVKNHPTDEGQSIPYLTPLCPEANITIVNTNPLCPPHPYVATVQSFDIHAAIRHADYFVTTYSTAAKEAIRIQAPLAILNLHQFNFYQNLVNAECAVYLRSEQDLLQDLQSTAPQDRIRNYQSTWSSLGIIPDLFRSRINQAGDNFAAWFNLQAGRQEDCP